MMKDKLNNIIDGRAYSSMYCVGEKVWFEKVIIVEDVVYVSPVTLSFWSFFPVSVLVSLSVSVCVYEWVCLRMILVVAEMW